MHAAKGILTTRGGMTSHAAVVARGMGRPCVSGAGDLRIDYAAGTLAVRNHLVRAGDLITINGSTGEVMLGEVPTIEPQLSGDFATLMGWADDAAQAEGPRQCRDRGRCPRRARLRRRGDRPVAHRAHVLRGRPHRRDARDDHGRRGARPARRARQAAADAARRLRRDLPHHARLAGDDPAARPAAARIPAEDRRRIRGDGAADRHERRRGAAARRTRCTRRTRCSAIAAAGSASPIPRSTRCRPSRSSRRRPR